jgi:hypothetical protein
MKQSALLTAIAITSAIAATPSFAKISSHSAGTYESAGTWVYARHHRHIRGYDIQVHRPHTGPELVNEIPFRSEG